MKSIRLTKKVREDIAMHMAMEAVESSLVDLKSNIAHAANSFWESHITDCESRLGITRDKWPELIRIGMLPAVREVSLKSSADSFNRELTISEGRPTDAVVLTHIPTPKFRYPSMKVPVVLVTPEPVPRFDGFDFVVEGSGLYTSIVKINEDLRIVMDTAADMYSKTMSVLVTCTTSRQLEDRLPEAVYIIIKRRDEDEH